MDVSGEGEPLWPVAQLPLSLFSLSLPLLSLVISLKLVPCPPFPFNFFSPLLSSQLPHTPPLFPVLPPFYERGRGRCEVY